MRDLFSVFVVIFVCLPHKRRRSTVRRGIRAVPHPQSRRQVHVVLLFCTACPQCARAQPCAARGKYQGEKDIDPYSRVTLGAMGARTERGLTPPGVRLQVPRPRHLHTRSLEAASRGELAELPEECLGTAFLSGSPAESRGGILPHQKSSPGEIEAFSSFEANHI